MNFRTVLTLMMLFLFFMTGSLAQSKPSPRPETSMNEREAAGKHIFLQHCSLCHLATYSKAVDWNEPHASPPPVGPRLAGLLKHSNPEQEKSVREFILQGSQHMPGFQYSLKPEEVNDLITYLKTL